jgi:Zn-dependent oligopeptidase
VSPYSEVKGDHELASFFWIVDYSSGEYTYLWDRAIAQDLFEQFDRGNLMDGQIATRYRREVLERTGSIPSNELIRNFLGSRQSIQPLIRWMEEGF